MKQQITLKQLEELQGEAKEKFIQWVEKKRTHDHYIFPKLTIDDYLLSIGQLLEFLDEHQPKDKGLLIIAGSGSIHKLCDDLWENVKQVLTS